MFREYNKAMKTAMRLIEYEKELGTKEVYSIVAVSCYFNQCFRECSKAFVKLERMPDITEKEREKYENLAISLFSRNPPMDRKTAKYQCPKSSCRSVISEFDVNCKECGSHFSPCIASGQSILAKVYYTCKTCKHKALDAELALLHLKHCTLCHGKIDDQTAEVMSINEAMQKAKREQAGTDGQRGMPER